MEVIIFFWFCSFCLQYQVQKEKALAIWVSKLCYSCLASDAIDACIKLQIPKVCRWYKYLVGEWMVLAEKISRSIGNPFLVYPIS